MLNKTKNKFLTFSDAINEALKQEMSKDKNVIIFGLGVISKKCFWHHKRSFKEIW